MSTTRSEWTTATSILTIIGLIISLGGNIYQGIQNSIVNAKADTETIRANQAERRAEDLQNQKRDWIAGLKKDLLEIDSKIRTLNENIRVESIGILLTNFSDSQKAQRQKESNSEELNNLLNKKHEIEQKIQEYMINSH
jgi:hypothetical protein